MQCCIGLGDIAAAFDNARVCVVYDALRARRLPPALIAAVIDEFRNLQATPMLQGIDFEEATVSWSKSIKQGGVEGPWCWNRIISWLISMLAPAWIQAGYGVVLSDNSDDDDGFRQLHRPAMATHAMWSDNIFIFAKNKSEFTLMMQSQV